MSTSACQIVDHLCLVNRAYQVLYALGDTSSTVRTLTPGEAACLVGIVSDLLDDRHSDWTALDDVLYQAMSPGMILYVAGSEAA